MVGGDVVDSPPSKKFHRVVDLMKDKNFQRNREFVKDGEVLTQHNMYR